MPEVGKRYYFISHAYWHFLGEVVEIISPRKVRLKNVAQILSCKRGWGEFFRDGCKKDTKYEVWPDGTVIECTLPFAPWPHEIPQ